MEKQFFNLMKGKTMVINNKVFQFILGILLIFILFFVFFCKKDFNKNVTPNINEMQNNLLSISQLINNKQTTPIKVMNKYGLTVVSQQILDKDINNEKINGLINYIEKDGWSKGKGANSNEISFCKYPYVFSLDYPNQESLFKTYMEISFGEYDFRCK
jgi:hypothetical protein